MMSLEVSNQIRDIIFSDYSEHEKTKKINDILYNQLSMAKSDEDYEVFIKDDIIRSFVLAIFNFEQEYSYIKNLK